MVFVGRGIKKAIFVIPKYGFRRGISLFRRLDPREILHFVQNDKISIFSAAF
jgi:hypothetical protein